MPSAITAGTLVGGGGGSAERSGPHIGISERDAGFYYEETAGNWRPVYQRRHTFSTAPNASTITEAHGISSVSRILPMSQFVSYASTADDVLQLGYVATANTDVDGMWADDTNVYWRSGRNISTWSGYAVLFYTKTTDTAVATPPD